MFQVYYASDNDWWDYLAHHGIKGQKHGVHNGPPYPLSRKLKQKVRRQAKINKGLPEPKTSDNIIGPKIKDGTVKMEMNPEKQLRHIRTGNTKYDGNRSYIDGDLKYADKLIKELALTGSPVLNNKGEWSNRKMERVVAKEECGVNIYDGKPTRTNKLMIVYSNTGTHIYPRR